MVSSQAWPPFEGSFSLDLNGHGPGAIAQTVTGLNPGQTYTLSFAYGRHRFWGTAPMTADVVGLVLAVAVATYLVAALLFPERF